MAREVCKIRTSIGGQALIEGVMMRGPQKLMACVRNPQGEIVEKEIEYTPLQKKHKVLGIPVLRGVVGFVESMVLGYKTMMYSAEVSGMEEMEAESKFDKWLEKTFGDKLMKVAGVIGGVLGLALAVVLFFWLPTFLFNLIPGTGEGGALGGWRPVFEGVLRMLIFIGYLALVSHMPEIRRVFQYHGAEHKTIFCYESMEELTVENVKKHSRFHPRCSTSFLIIMLIIGIIIGFFIKTPDPVLRTLFKLLLLPLIMGVGYELIRLCGRHDNIVTRVIATPGLWMQRLTTKEPEDEMIEVAIQALRQVVPENGEDRL